MAGHSSASRTRPSGTERTYLSPMPTVYVTDARQPSGRRVQPSQDPVRQVPSSCSTSTGRGSSYRRTSSSTTDATVGGTPVDRTPKPCRHPRARHEHGQRLGYMLDGCRCLPCCAANSEYESRRVRLRAYGRGTPSGLIDAQPVRDHVEALQAAGMGWKRIAAAAGVPNGTMSRLLFGKPEQGYGPSKRINPDAAERLLAVPLPTPEQLGGGTVIDGTGTRRRLQALVAAGWSQAALAAKLDMSAGNFGSLIHGHRRKAGAGRVLAFTHRAVAALYDELWDAQPPTGRGRHDAARAAQRYGWPPPAAWDDDTIDDPDATPALGDDDVDLVDELAVDAVLDGHQLQLTGATLHAAVHALVTAGRGTAAIAERLGIHERQVLRLRDRTRAPRSKRAAA